MKLNTIPIHKALTRYMAAVCLPGRMSAREKYCAAKYRPVSIRISTAQSRRNIPFIKPLHLYIPIRPSSRGRLCRSAESISGCSCSSSAAVPVISSVVSPAISSVAASVTSSVVCVLLLSSLPLISICPLVSPAASRNTVLCFPPLSGTDNSSTYFFPMEEATGLSKDNIALSSADARIFSSLISVSSTEDTFFKSPTVPLPEVSSAVPLSSNSFHSSTVPE